MPRRSRTIARLRGLHGLLGLGALLRVRETEARQAAILASALDGILTLDVTGRLHDVNPAGARMLGRRPEELLGRHVADVASPPARRAQDRAAVDEHLAALASGRRPPELVETVAARADGTVFPCEVALALIERDGRPPLFTAYLRDISERVAGRRALEVQRDRARHAALHDALTGLPNRAAAEDRLARLESHAAPGSVAALCVDLDEFRLINESLGHAAGDELLCAVAIRLTGALLASSHAPELAAALAEPPLVARLGGAEFLLVLVAAGSGEAASEAAAGAVHAALARPFAVGGVEVGVPARVGVAVLEDGSPRHLLRHAEAAVARAKRDEEPVVRFSADRDDAQRRLALAAGLRRALEREELELHYQPVVSLADHRVVGFEALLRWRRADGTLVAPGDFIPLAESSGLIEPIGEWVIEQACAQAAAWAPLRPLPPVVGVNLSPRQLRTTDVVRILGHALDRHAIAPGDFCVEVTETALAHGSERMQRTLLSLRELGVRIALDDFGTEHSSLDRLRRLPIEMLKLDRSFLAGVPEDPRATEFLAALLALPGALGLRTVVEGVETPAQREAVLGLGAPLGQGFGLHRPMPVEAATRLLTRDAVQVIAGAAQTGPAEPAPHRPSPQSSAAARSA